MQIADLAFQLEAARNAVVQLHTRLTAATEQQQAVASQQSQRMQQLETQQAALNSRLDSMTFTISSSQDKNASAICDMRSTTHGFLTELISLVGQQFGKLQAELKQSQANEIKAEIQNALNGARSSEAGTSLLEQLVQKAVADSVKQHLDVQISRCAASTALASQDGMPSDTHNGKDPASAAENGINNTNSRRQDAGLPDNVGGRAAQVQSCFTEPCKPGGNQDASVCQGAFQGLSPIAAGRPPVTRSQDSLSLMHHATAAGSRTPTPPKLGSARRRSSGQSPAESRQALVGIDLNQPFASLQTSPGFTHIAWQRHQPIEQRGRQSNRQEEQLNPKPVLQQCSQPGMQQRRDAGSRQNKQLRWADTARQLDQQLMRGSQPPATSSRTETSPGSSLPNTPGPGSDQMSGQDNGGAATMNKDQHIHAEELQALPQMHNPTRTAQPQQTQSLTYPLTAQHLTSGLDGKVPPSYDSHHDASSAANRSPCANYTRGYRQYASERLDHMQPPHTAPGLAVVVGHALGCQQHAMQQLLGAHRDCSLAAIGSMHRQPVLHDVEESDLPAGIPLTPIPVQQPQPRDSLEASIWKLSGTRRQETVFRDMSAVLKMGAHSPSQYIGPHEHHQQHFGVQKWPQLVLQDTPEVFQGLTARSLGQGT